VTELSLVAGFIYLLVGGDVLVRGSVALARRLQVPAVFVAATVVGFGTSLPELVVSVQATLDGYPGLILGNVVGSNIANVLLVGGASAAVYPLMHDDRDARRNIGLMAFSVLLFSALCVWIDLGQLAGAALLVIFLALMMSSLGSAFGGKEDRDSTTPLDWILGIPTRVASIALFIIVGVVFLPVGANLLVQSAIEMAARLDVSDTVVGLSILAIGTSLPELVTTVLAALERRTDVALGAIVGSNTFNVLAIMGVTAAMSSEPIPVSTRFLWLDLPVMLVTSLTLATVAWKARPIGRGWGISMLLAYCAYLSTLYLVA